MQPIAACMRTLQPRCLDMSSIIPPCALAMKGFHADFCWLQIFHASPKLAAVGSVDEAVVIGAALALSSSAFVLQLMSERGELATKFGSATLGILLLQVLLPLNQAAPV